MEKSGRRKVEKEGECIPVRWEEVQRFSSHSLASLRKFLLHTKGIVDREEEMKGKRRGGWNEREEKEEMKCKRRGRRKRREEEMEWK